MGNETPQSVESPHGSPSLPSWQVSFGPHKKTQSSSSTHGSPKLPSRH
jgi:hypothetical protein